MRLASTLICCAAWGALVVWALGRSPDQLADHLPDALRDPLAWNAAPPPPEPDGSVESIDLALERGKLVELAEEIRAWHATHGTLPTSLEDLVDGGDMASGNAILPEGAPRRPLDAWGHEIAYRAEAGAFEVRAAGPDGLLDTGDDLVERIMLDR
jgi:hypothetical protein